MGVWDKINFKSEKGFGEIPKPFFIRRQLLRGPLDLFL